MIRCEVWFPDAIFYIEYPAVPRVGDSLYLLRTGDHEGTWKVQEVGWITSGRYLPGMHRALFQRVVVKVA